MKNIVRLNITYGFFLLMLCIFTLISCDETDSPISERFAGDEIEFGAMLKEDAGLKTRTPSKDSTILVSHERFNTDFYIELKSYDNDSQEITKYGIYEVSNGYEGRLDSKIDWQPLNWQSLRGDHTFYGWTFPTGNVEGYNITNPFADSKYPDNLKPIEIYFRDSQEGTNGYDLYDNNSIYETFIGMKEGPITYIKNGSYVPLYFRHLVSKIYIQELILDLNGSIQKHLKADMTFYGMPHTATFVPRPEDGGAPMVLGPEIYNLNDELTYHIKDKVENGVRADYFYIPPEIDFSQISFSISLSSTEEGYNELKEYSGNFRNVIFDRSGVNWDNVDGNGTWSGDDSTILHAGEMMILRIILYPGGGGGLYVKILPWSTNSRQESVHHAKPGIYSDTVLNELATNADGDASDLFTLYGETIDGEKVFNLYENAKLTYVNGSNQSELRVKNGYILEGNGHLITASKSTVKVRNVRNVYLTDGKGNYVFIDSAGDIWKVNPTTFELESPKLGTMRLDYSTTINVTAGTIV